ncbi:MAG: SIMPL domain-containing protein [Patescibacteria group bacterium]
MGIVCVGVILFFYAAAFKDIRLGKNAGKAPTEVKTITIDGAGKITAVPDIGTVDVGFMTEGKNVQAIQKENVAKMNKLIDAIKKLGIDSKDIQTTQYQIYPKYDYTNGRSALAGYTISQSIMIKIHDLDKISEVLAKAGDSGANQVGGLNFTFDDPEDLKVQVRGKAILNAKGKAEVLANSLGIKLGRIVGFSEGGSSPYPYPLYKSAEGYGVGGGGAAPAIEAGSLDITSNVSITYEIRGEKWGWKK